MVAPRPKEAVLGPEKEWAGGQARSSHEQGGWPPKSTVRALLHVPAVPLRVSVCRARSSLSPAFFLTNSSCLFREPPRGPLLGQDAGLSTGLGLTPLLQSPADPMDMGS